MEDADSRLIDKLKHATGQTVSEFRSQPVDFLYESDIRSLLFAKLRHEMSDIRYESEAKDVERFFKSVPRINPVKTEYGLNLQGSRARFDVAVLSAEQDPSFNIWRQPCRIAIEVKLWQPDGTGEGPWKDVKKLQSYWQASNSLSRRFTGIAMLFVHPGAEKWLGNIDGMSAGADFPNDGVILHVVSSLGWNQVSTPAS